MNIIKKLYIHYYICDSVDDILKLYDFDYYNIDYPFYVENGMDIRKKLAEMKIYIPTLWPNVLRRIKRVALNITMLQIYSYCLVIRGMA